MKQLPSVVQMERNIVSRVYGLAAAGLAAGFSRLRGFLDDDFAWSRLWLQSWSWPMALMALTTSVSFLVNSPVAEHFDAAGTAIGQPDRAQSRFIHPRAVVKLIQDRPR